ncbi:YfiR family protein [Nitrosomonas sp. sh817]|uniref:YfiR family protein n=1 Tax=Nitrosomonas sp. sh817 TaxID=3070658 RepID=UPI0027DAFE6C|nr:YfiR family protein [Nitrosomonas sp. sh817]WMJ09524.1 YfiR family protein [Nitrosomonas sp. sh817]
MTMNMRKLAQQITLLITSSNRSMRRWLLAALLIMAQPFTASIAHAGETLEYQVKAAFIYNFIAFTQWPGSAEPAINLCLYGEDYFGDEIDKLQNKTVGTRQIKVVRTNNIDRLQQCHAIFFSKSANNDLANLVNSLESYPILTLADTPNAISRGIIINMNLVNEKIVFEINLAAARKSGLDISSKLLQLATKVHQ